MRRALDRGYMRWSAYAVNGSVPKLDEFAGRTQPSCPGRPDDRPVIEQAPVAGCGSVIPAVLMRQLSTKYSRQAAPGGARPRPAGRSASFSPAVALHLARRSGCLLTGNPDSRSLFSGRIAKLLRAVDLDDQVEACQRIRQRRNVDRRAGKPRIGRQANLRSSGLESACVRPDSQRQHGAPGGLLRCSWLPLARKRRLIREHPRSSVAGTPSALTAASAVIPALGRLCERRTATLPQVGQHPRAIADQRRIKKTTTTTIRITTSSPPPMYMIGSLVFSAGRPPCSARSSSRTDAHDR